MNILILNWKCIKNPTAGGAELVTYEHAKRWVKKGHKVIWLASSFKGSKKDEIIDDIKIVRFGNIYQVYLYAPFFYLFSGNKFDLVVDEVHGIPFFTPFYVRKPVVVLLHEIAGEIWDYMYSFPLNSIGRFLEKLYLKLYSKNSFWTDCKSTIDELVEFGIIKKNCLAIPCPSNLKVLSELPKKNKNLTLVWVSRIVKMKGIEDVIEAFSIVNKVEKNAKLIIVGDGEEKYVKYLKKNVVKEKKLDKNIEFKGFLSEKEKTGILRKSHLLLHASVKEGWGIVVIEAASQATPSIVYNVSGLNESVKDDKTGIVLSNNNPSELAQEVIKIFKNQKKYRFLQKNCLKWAESLNWDNASKLSMSLLHRTNKND